MSGGNLLVLAVVQLALTALPGVASTLLAARFGVRAIPVLLSAGLAGSGALAMLTFWVYYVAPSLGPLCAYAVLCGSIGVVVWCWPAISKDRELVRQLTVPLALWTLARTCLFVFGVVLWGLLLFGNVQSRAIVTEGSLALPIVAVAGLVAGLRATHPSLATGLVVVNATTVLLLYAPALEPAPGTSYSAFAAVAAAACLAGFAAILFGPQGRSFEDPRLAGEP